MQQAVTSITTIHTIKIRIIFVKAKIILETVIELVAVIRNIPRLPYRQSFNSSSLNIFCYLSSLNLETRQYQITNQTNKQTNKTKQNMQVEKIIIHPPQQI